MDTGDRNTYPPFTPEEATQIRRLLVTPGTRLVCPRCGTELSESSALGGSMSTYTFIYCDRCRRSMVLRDFPRPSQP